MRSKEGGKVSAFLRGGRQACCRPGVRSAEPAAKSFGIQQEISLTFPPLPIYLMRCEYTIFLENCQAGDRLGHARLTNVILRKN